MRDIWRNSASYLAYLLLLMGFVSLGLFVAALATGSILAGVLGAVLIACLAGSVAGFRSAAHKLAHSRPVAEPESDVSIFSTPLRREQIDRYLENYRGEATRTERRMTVLEGGGRKRIPTHAGVAPRLSA